MSNRRSRLPAGTPLLERLHYWTDVDDQGCWVWQGSKSHSGYGQISMAGVGASTQRVHRVAYELLVGPIPVGFEVDHLCRVRDCWRPEHLEAVTPDENDRRRRVAKCRRGHSLTGTNVNERDGRRCATCHRHWHHYAKQDGTEYVRKPHWAAVHVSDETVAAIRSEYRRGVKGHDQHALAARYGLSRPLIQKIVTQTGRWQEAA